MLGEDVVVDLGAAEGAAEAFGLTFVSSPLTFQTLCPPLQHADAIPLTLLPQQ